MHTNKGYIVPVILILILLLIAGIFIFSQPVIAPVSEDNQTPIATTTTPRATTTIPDPKEDKDETPATTTASSTLDISISEETEI